MRTEHDSIPNGPRLPHGVTGWQVVMVALVVVGVALGAYGETWPTRVLASACYVAAILLALWKRL